MNIIRNVLFLGLSLTLGACAASEETQALRAEYTRTIPECSSAENCADKWAAARTWVIRNTDFPIRAESDTRIMATSALTSQSGIGVTVDRTAAANGFQIIVGVECFSAFGCPNVNEMKVDFNRAVNAVP